MGFDEPLKGSFCFVSSVIAGLRERRACDETNGGLAETEAKTVVERGVTMFAFVAGVDTVVCWLF